MFGAGRTGTTSPFTRRATLTGTGGTLLTSPVIVRTSTCRWVEPEGWSSRPSTCGWAADFFEWCGAIAMRVQVVGWVRLFREVGLVGVEGSVDDGHKQVDVPGVCRGSETGSCAGRVSGCLEDGRERVQSY